MPPITSWAFPTLETNTEQFGFLLIGYFPSEHASRQFDWTTNLSPINSIYIHALIECVQVL